MPDITLPANVLDIIDTLQAHGFQAFVVGGCVRDSLLGRVPKDWDIATDATPAQMREIFGQKSLRQESCGRESYGRGICAKDSFDREACAPEDRSRAYTLIALGERFGTIMLLPSAPNSSSSSSTDSAIEITTFRLESAYSDNRRPSDVAYTSSLLDDLKRRDFTCNALAYNPYLSMLASTPDPSPLRLPKLDQADSQAALLYGRYVPYLCDGVCDCSGGVADIATRTLRAVGDASERFGEDALRILRALRFCASLGFSLESSTRAALFANAPKLAAISAQRKQEEWSKILHAKHVSRAIVGFGAVWAEVFLELVLPLQQLDSRPSATMRATLATLESLNATPPESACRDVVAGSMPLDSQPLSADAALSLRLSLWFHALDSSPECAASSLQALCYKSRIIKLCTLLLSYATLPRSQSLESTRILARDLGLESLSLLCCFLSLLHGRDYAAPLAAHLSTIHAQKLCYNLATLAINGHDLAIIAQTLGVELAGVEVGRLLRALLDEVICSHVPNTKAALLARARAQILLITNSKM